MDRGGAMILWLCILFLFSGCAEPPPARREYVLGTLCTINLFEKGSAEAYREIFARLREIEDRMSVNKDGTEVDAINRSAGVAPVKVHPDVLFTITRALHFAELSGGVFDPTVGPLVKLWGIGTEAERIPGAEEIAAVLPLVNWRDVRVDPAAGTVFLARPGMRLDLGAIAKGYAADEAARLIRARGIPRAIVDLGGNILALGARSDGKPWRIGVQDPAGERGAYTGVLQVRDKTMVTSGIYERFFLQEGKRYHHILSTRDGYPITNGLSSVTILADRSIDADGFSTTVFALGYDQGRALVEATPGVDAIFVFEDFTIRTTRGLAENFTTENGGYRFIE